MCGCRLQVIVLLSLESTSVLAFYIDVRVSQTFAATAEYVAMQASMLALR